MIHVCRTVPRRLRFLLSIGVIGFCGVTPCAHAQTRQAETCPSRASSTGTVTRTTSILWRTYVWEFLAPLGDLNVGTKVVGPTTTSASYNADPVDSYNAAALLGSSQMIVTLEGATFAATCWDRALIIPPASDTVWVSEAETGSAYRRNR